MLNESGSAGAVEAADSGVSSALPYTRMAAAMAVSGMEVMVNHVLAERFPHVPESDRQAYAIRLLGLSGGSDAIAGIFLQTHGKVTVVALGGASARHEQSLHDFAPRLESAIKSTLNKALEVAGAIRNAVRMVMGTQRHPNVIANVEIVQDDVVIEGVPDDRADAIVQALSPSLIQPVLTGSAMQMTQNDILQAVRKLKEGNA